VISIISKSMILFYLLAVAPLQAYSQKIFMCIDASGRTLTSDRPIPECAGRAVREYDKYGTVRRDIPAPLTAEQKRQKQLEEEKHKADEASAAEQKRNDHALMVRYRNEKDIETARKREVDLVLEKIRQETSTVIAAETKQQEALAQVAQFKSKKDVPPSLQHQIGTSGRELEEDKRKLQDYAAEITQINLKYDATLKRYRQVSTTLIK
jgi:hypothetical protein